MSFVPTSQHERHQKYFDAFLLKKELTDSKYFNYITQFISDPNLSYLDKDDMSFFQDLLFESFREKVYIKYYDWVTKWFDFAGPQTITTLSNYSNYLGEVSELFLEDFFNHIFKLSKRNLIVDLFESLSSQNRLRFIKWADGKPEVVKLIPRLKFYLLFT
jgi:hypothetical protein